MCLAQSSPLVVFRSLLCFCGYCAPSVLHWLDVGSSVMEYLLGILPFVEGIWETCSLHVLCCGWFYGLVMGGMVAGWFCNGGIIVEWSWRG